MSGNQITSGQRRLAVVLVHYHAPRLAAAAIAALQRDLAGGQGAAAAVADLEVEWVLVDNGSDPAGRELLAGLPVRLLEPGRNLGFAGGVNLGVASSRAELVLLMNPDVSVLPGCTAALVGSLLAGAAAAGPRFYWDHGRRLLLPPSEPRSRRGELSSWLAARDAGWAAGARRRSRRHCRRHWQAAAPLPSYSLSGSLLAVTRAAWERIGGFDAGYQLYFEETDWLLRLRRAGLPAWFVPAAEAVHLYGRSAAVEPRAAEWFESSARRFRRRHYGAWFAWCLARLDRLAGGAGSPRPGPRPLPLLPEAGLELGAYPRPLWIEVSPNVAGFPAAAERIDDRAPGGRWTLPAEVADRVSGGGWQVWLSDERGRDLAGFRLAGGGGEAAGGG
ncbi:MAG TPA: glycosyltransferase [Thermoanaerobaculia bacterium]|jgi:GT2 family glycosyltransferase|nr:glycosyltransferase [Thermoanaerobaculia bacterium]